MLRPDTAQLPIPRVDGDREGLRILLGARRELTTVRTMQISRLRALLLTGDDADRALSRGPLTDIRLNSISRRRGKAGHSVEASVRRAEAQRLAIAIRETANELKANKKQLAAMVHRLAPSLQDKVGIGPVSAAQAIVSLVAPGTLPQRRRIRSAGRHQPRPRQ